MSTAASPHAPHLALEIHPASRWPQLQPVWAELAEDSPYGSFFLTSEWTGAWLSIWGDRLRPEILVFRSGGVPMAICLLVRRTEFHGPVPVRRVYLNTAGEDPAESAHIEFNNLLCRAGWEKEAACTLAAHLARLPWDETALNGFCPGPQLETLMQELTGTRAVIRTFPSPYVDLRELRAKGQEFVDSLGSTTRKRLRQNSRYYSALGGEPVVESASAEEHAVAGKMFGELMRLHQRSWTGRGKPGVFSAPRFVEFHKRLIRDLLPSGRVHLLRVSMAGETIGAVYGFIHRGKVSFYQSGFNYPDDKRLSPGSLTLTCAITRCLHAGLDEYDFLAGDSQYKKVLGAKSRELHWVLLQRPIWRLRLLKALRAVRNMWHRSRQRLAKPSREIRREDAANG